MDTTIGTPAPDVKGARQDAPPARHVLLHLSDSGLTVADENADIRGRNVLDANGAEIGKVEDLLIERTNAMFASYSFARAAYSASVSIDSLSPWTRSRG
jgi:hypothetical protein